MDEIPSNPGPTAAPPPSSQAPASTSLPARLLNVFASPGEVFEEVKNSATNAANWIVPVLLAIVVGVAAVMVMFSNPSVVQRIRDQQSKVIDDQVKAGKMTQQEANKRIAVMEKVAGPTVLKITGSIGVVAATVIRVFWWALVLWLLGLLFLKVRFSYLKALEVAGLALTITVLQSIVVLLLTVNFGKITATNLDVFFANSDPSSKIHPVLAVIDVFSFWLVCVMAVGLARLAGKRFGRAFLLVAGYWLAFQFVLISAGMLLQAAFSAGK